MSGLMKSTFSFSDSRFYYGPYTLARRPSEVSIRDDGIFPRIVTVKKWLKSMYIHFFGPPCRPTFTLLEKAHLITCFCLFITARSTMLVRARYYNGESSVRPSVNDTDTESCFTHLRLSSRIAE